MAKTRITIVGCGFVGTAVALALRALYKDIEIVGHDKDQSHIQRAEKLKAIDRGNWNLPAACENAQLIVLSIPLDAIEPTMRAIAPDILPGAIVMDTCTVKAPIAGMVKKYVPENAAYISSDIVFNPVRVPTTVKLEAITADVFKGAIWTLTPIVASPDAVDSITGLVSATGAKPVFMDALEHDGLRLSVDTVPSALSSALLLAITSDSAWRERQWLAGSTFDAATSNVESSHAEEIATALVAQKEASSHWLNQIMLQLMNLRDVIEQGRVDKLTTILSQARENREKWAAEWYRGREDNQANVEVKRPNLLGMLVGSRFASQLENPTGRKATPKKDDDSRR